MKSFISSTGTSTGTQLVDTFTNLSQNTTSANVALGKMLINEQHRYFLQKYFDNERIFNLLTIGPQALAFTVSSGTTGVISGGTQGTLTSAWTKLSCQQQISFTNSDQRLGYFTQGSSTVTWQSGLSSSAGTTATLIGVQSYPLPANISKVKNGTITIGQLVYTPAPVQSIQEWTKLNALPYTAAYPAYFYIYNNQINFWPIPSADNYPITIYGQTAVADMTYADYSTGSIGTMTVGSNAIVGTSTAWNNNFPIGVDLTYANLYLIVTPPNGDGMPYQIQQFNSATSATLTKQVVNAPNIGAGANYTIGQYPLLFSDFHDAIVYGALRIYYQSIVKDPDRYALYNGLLNEKLTLMEGYLSTKQVNVDLSVTPIQANPNLYFYPTSSS